MIQAMPRPRPPHLQRQVTRHGKAVWYVRIAKGPRVRIRAQFGTPEFDVEYQAALTESPRPARQAPLPGTLAWLIARYRETTGWSDLSLATRRQRENIFHHVIQTAGGQLASKITVKTVLEGRDRRAHTPAQARNFLDAIRGLFRWAHQAGLVKTDPTIGVKNPKRRKGPGFPAWTEDDGLAYERRWPLGTKERVWFEVLLNTGGRRGDAVRLGRPHVRDGVATFRTEKSQGEITITIPILPPLVRALEAGPCGDLTFIAGERGRPMTKESFGNEFSKAARAAGVKKSAHGVRKLAATRAANNGATVAQLNAIFGWTGSAMASLYTREADRRRLGLEAAHLLANDMRTSIPSPLQEVRAAERKD